MQNLYPPLCFPGKGGSREGGSTFPCGLLIATAKRRRPWPITIRRGTSGRRVGPASGTFPVLPRPQLAARWRLLKDFSTFWEMGAVTAADSGENPGRHCQRPPLIASTSAGRAAPPGGPHGTAQSSRVSAAPSIQGPHAHLRRALSRGEAEGQLPGWGTS